MTYRVTTTRTEEISFDVEAQSAEDAKARFLYDGDEVYASTTSTVITNVEVV